MHEVWGEPITQRSKRRPGSEQVTGDGTTLMTTTHLQPLTTVATTTTMDERPKREMEYIQMKELLQIWYDHHCTPSPGPSPGPSRLT